MLTPENEAALDSMLAAPDEDATPANEATQEATESELPAETETDPAPEADEDNLPEGDTFKREYVEKLRRESASYRERAKKYQEAFDGYEDEAVGEWLRLAQSLRNDPKGTAEELAQLVEQINNAYSEQESKNQELDAERQVAEGEYLSRAEVERMFAEREQKADTERRIAQIELDAQNLGYKLGSEEYDELLWTASKLQSGSIKDAHEKLESRNQAIYDRMIEKMNGKDYKVPAGVTPPGEDRKIKTFEEANAALDAWLAGQG